MKKDYVPVDNEVTMGEETHFVEKFWTDRWRDGQVSEADFAEVARREEARIIEPYIGSFPPGLDCWTAAADLVTGPDTMRCAATAWSGWTQALPR